MKKQELASCYSAVNPEAGVDEAGRGCLAGPVVAAAVILPKRCTIPGLDDSKKMTSLQRDRVRQLILQTALSWAIGMGSPEEIDQLNIVGATYLAMHRAIQKLSVVPKLLLIDGKYFRPYKSIPFTCLVGGDGRYMAIAAASVLAKTTRDTLMQKLHQDYPMYGWDKNKGYPTKEHREGIRNHGTTPYHRKSFRLLDEQLPIPFHTGKL